MKVITIGKKTFDLLHDFRSCEKAAMLDTRRARELERENPDAATRWYASAKRYKEDADAKLEEFNAQLVKLSTAIKETEERASVRRLDATEVIVTLTDIDAHLGRFSTKTDAVGTVAVVNLSAQSFPSAYHYVPMSTHFEAVKTSGGWKITNIYRDHCGKTKVKLTLTEATKAKMAETLSIIK